MNMRLTIGLLVLSIVVLFSSESLAQEKTNLGGYLVPMCVYNGDTIPAFQIPTIHIFKPLKFRNRKEQMEYYKLVRNVKKVYPIAREINRTNSITRSVNLSSPSGSYCFFKLTPKRAATAVSFS
jgi:hypothetical protein